MNQFIYIVEVIDICDERSDINKSEAIITSPGYPKTNYPKNLDCVKVVNFPEETPFRVKFLGEFDLDPFRCMTDDFIEIRNGKDEDAPLILKACGSKKPQSISLIGDSVWMKFKSDTSSDQGFSLRISKLARSEGKLT